MKMEVLLMIKDGRLEYRIYESGGSMEQYYPKLVHTATLSYKSSAIVNALRVLGCRFSGQSHDDEIEGFIREVAQIAYEAGRASKT